MTSAQDGRRSWNRRWLIVIVAAVLVAGGAIWYTARDALRTAGATATISATPLPTNSRPSRVVLGKTGLVLIPPDMTRAVSLAVTSGVVKPTDGQWLLGCGPLRQGQDNEVCTMQHATRSAPRFIMITIDALPSVAESTKEFASQRQQHGPGYAVGDTAGAVEPIPGLGDDAFSVRFRSASDLPQLPLDWWLGGAVVAARFRNVVLGVRYVGPAYAVEPNQNQAPPVPTASYPEDKTEAIAIMRLLIARLS